MNWLRQADEYFMSFIENALVGNQITDGEFWPKVLRRIINCLEIDEGLEGWKLVSGSWL